jgi:hypothetical protein
MTNITPDKPRTFLGGDAGQWRELMWMLYICSLFLAVGLVIGLVVR